MNLRYLLIFIVVIVCGMIVVLNQHPRRELIKRIETSAVDVVSISVSIRNETVHTTDEALLKVVNSRLNNSNLDPMSLNFAEWFFSTVDLYLDNPEHVVEEVEFWVNLKDEKFCMRFYINKADDELPVGFYISFADVSDPQLLSFINGKGKGASIRGSGQTQKPLP